MNVLIGVKVGAAVADEAQLDGVPVREVRMTWQKFTELFNTDPLALGAVAGLAVTIVVSISLFTFMMTRHDPKVATKKPS